jgi:tetratricopeptide (TPR) repeat protein
MRRVERWSTVGAKAGGAAGERGAMRGLIAILILLVALAGAGAAQVAVDDGAACTRSTGDTAVTACTRTIASRRWVGSKLAFAYHNRARGWASKSDYDRAIVDYTEALRLDPNYVQAFYGRAVAWTMKANHDRAIADFDQAIRFDPRQALVYESRGVAWAAKGDRDRAVADFDQALRLDPKLVRAVFRRATIHAQKGDHDRAIASYDQAISIAPKYVAAYFNRGLAWQAKGNPKRAIADYSRTILLDPTYAAAYTQRGLAFELSGERERARSDYYAALAVPQQHPNSKWAHDTARLRVSDLASAKPTLAAAPPQIAAAPAVVEASPRPPLAAAVPDEPGRRVALVIGNNAYTKIDRLQKAVNDARAVADTLTKLGFEVIRVEDADRRTINEKLSDFYAKVGGGDTAFFFFAGHGIEIRNTNYLLATDVPKVNDGQERLVIAEGIAASAISDALREKGARVSVLVLDACRDNPFKAAGGRSIGAAGGLAHMAASEGEFVLYSAGVGQIALDRLTNADPNPNSVFTRVFVKLLKQRGLSLQEIAKNTQAEVKKLAATVRHMQLPAYYDQIIGNLVLAPK